MSGKGSKAAPTVRASNKGSKPLASKPAINKKPSAKISAKLTKPDPDSARKARDPPFLSHDMVAIFKAHNAYINSDFKKEREYLQAMWEGIKELAMRDYEADLSTR